MPSASGCARSWSGAGTARRGSAVSDVPPERPHLKHWPARLPHDLALPETSLWANLDIAARRWPTRPMLLFFGRAFGFAELHAQANALAGWLQAVGVHAGDRVLLFAQNCPQWVAAFYGILRADAVVVPVNPMNRADELAHLIADAQARVVICGADLAEVVEAADGLLPPAERLQHRLLVRYADALPDGPIDAAIAPSAALDAWLRADLPLPHGALRWADVLAARHVPGPPAGGPDALALLAYTSGTTGHPKGCMHTHRTLMHNAVGGSLWGSAGAEAVSLGVLPMFHITGLLYGVLGPAYVGSTVVVMPRWDRELAAALIARHHVTHWTCIPTMIVDLLASPNLARFELGSLRQLGGGGAAMPQVVAERLRDSFGLVFAEGYGLTETAAPSHINPPDAPKLQCLGIPIFGVDSRVVDPQTLHELPPGEVGEIITRGPMLFQGYWGQPEATRAAFVDFEGRRFLRTGDLGRMDEDGYFFLTDRLKRMINASGYKVWPAEVELLLYRHPAVLEACVIAARDSYRGETVKAVVVLRDEARGRVGADEIMAWARERMAAYKVPRQVEFVERLPKSGSGKVMWRLLQDRQAQRDGG